MKKKWNVREKHTSIRYYDYIVEAETEEEAKLLVSNGDVTVDDCNVAEDSIVIDEVDEIDE
jgi:hypothetical protein